MILILILGLAAGGGLVGVFTLSAADLIWGESIGVVEIKGVIQESEPIIRTLINFSRSKNVKAIILRIDTPGGGVAATQEIYKEIIRAREKKKIIASLGSMATSGGLYVAAAADRVMANPATVTGSIGVIMQLVNVENLLEKVGVRSVVIKSGPYKDMGSITRTMKEEEKKLLLDVVNQLHHQFVRDLAKARHLEEGKVSALADGRIFTGEEAIHLGLVDELGNFRDAVDAAKKLAGLKGSPKLIYPRKRDSLLKELLFNRGPLKLIPEWMDKPLSFQYIYLPGV
ncbi:MAG: signal peptide peptidase SppA [Pseudomonadota bacterium]